MNWASGQLCTILTSRTRTEHHVQEMFIICYNIIIVSFISSHLAVETIVNEWLKQWRIYFWFARSCIKQGAVTLVDKVQKYLKHYVGGGVGHHCVSQEICIDTVAPSSDWNMLIKIYASSHFGFVKSQVAQHMLVVGGFDPVLKA